MNNKNWLYTSVLVISFACVVLMNVFSIPAHDELSYAFMGQSTSSVGFCPRVASLMDIVRQQYNDYMHANGRIFVHGLVAFFAGFRLYYIYDIINSCVWFAFVLLMLKESLVKINLRHFVCGSLVMFILWWYNENVSMNAAFGINYLWMACATLAIMRLWRKLNSWLWIPVGFVYGWGQEIFSLPMVATLGGYIVIKSLYKKHYVASAKQTTFLIAMIVGAFGLVMSPGIRARASGSLNFSVVHFSVVVMKWLLGLALSVWPIVILLLVLGVLWKSRKTLFVRLYEDLEWWLFFVVSFGLSLLTCESGLYRICSGWLMAGIIIFMRTMRPSFLESKVIYGLSCLSFVWLLIGTVLQVSYGVSNYKMLRVYNADEQGITYREVVPPMLWNNVCSVGIYNPFHLNLFRQEYRKAKSPIILSKNLYETLYENPVRFFETCDIEGDTYIYSAAEGLAVKKGCVDFTEEEKAKLVERIAPKGLRKLMPGRLRTMFLSDIEYTCIPSRNHMISFIAKDGNWYTLYKYLH